MLSRFTDDNYMRQEFDTILSNYGHDVYLQRRNDDDTYKDSLEIHTVRFSVTGTGPLTGLKQELNEGILNTSERIYYFRYDANPFDNDRIYEIELGPRDNQTVWVIDGAVPMFGIGGKLVYYAVGATRIRPN